MRRSQCSRWPESALEATGGNATSIERALDAVARAQPKYVDRPAVHRLMRACEQVLRDEQLMWDWDQGTSDGECRFLDVDRIWEMALAERFKRGASDLPSVDVAFHPLRASSTRLLADGGPEIDPDLTLNSPAGVRVVVDAKNSVTDTWQSADVYQVLCYAQRLGAPASLLVYLAEKTWTTIVGRGHGGVTIAAAGVSVSSPSEGLSAVMGLTRDLYR